MMSGHRGELPVKVLVAGWFSFEHCNATAGDILSREVLCAWLSSAGIAYDVSAVPPFAGDMDWRSADPADYTHVAFVCGPFPRNSAATELLARFAGKTFLGVNLSMTEPVIEWNPFDLLLERDSSRGVRPDLVFLSEAPKVPVVGSLLVHDQKEYGERAMHQVAHEAVARLLGCRELTIVAIDTVLADNSTYLRTAREVESLIARVDAVVSTRLHGAVLALKNGVPAVAIDPIAGGAKVLAQMRAVGWPHVFTADRLDDDDLGRALDYALTEPAREKARACHARAIELLGNLKHELLDFLRPSKSSGAIP